MPSQIPIRLLVLFDLLTRSLMKQCAIYMNPESVLLNDILEPFPWRLTD